MTSVKLIQFKLLNKIAIMPFSKYIAGFSIGALYCLGFAPYRYWFLTIISLLSLIYLWRNSTPKQAFIIGWCYGLGAFGFGVYWIITCSKDYFDFEFRYAFLLYFIIINMLSFFIALIGYLIKRFHRDYNLSLLILGLPAYWVIFEWLHSWLLTGFPWLILGYTQMEAPLKGYAPIISVYGVSWLMMLTTASIYILLNSTQFKASTRIIASTSIVIIWVAGFLLQGVAWTKLDPLEHKVSLIQTNTNTKAKRLLSFQEHARIYSPLTIANLDAELIIWPESSLPYFLPYSANYLQEIDKLGKQNNTTILLGTLNSAPELFKNDKLYLFNSAMAVGVGTGEYQKHRLVPFAEYLPFEKYLAVIYKKFGIEYSRIVKGDVTATSLALPSGNILPAICYEIAYAESLRKNLKHTAANALVNMSEDGWFGNSNALALNLDFARMRALESGRYLLRAATKGISGIINEKGDLVAASRPFVTDSVRGVFYNATGLTPWTQLGMAPLICFMYLSLLLSFQKKRLSR